MGLRTRPADQACDQQGSNAGEQRETEYHHGIEECHGENCRGE